MKTDIKKLFDELKTGNRLALAKIITFLESERKEDQLVADEVMRWIYTQTQSLQTCRWGVTGPPGAGKSSLIEKMGMELIRRGYKVAVLAIDPSSEMTHGSILGDKTRMEELSASEHAFIRPSPSRGYLGGVNVATHDAILACECAGYNFVIVETVGVGQSETQVADLVDIYSLVALPGSGDELQGIKRGLLEKVDCVLVNKCDGENKVSAQVAQKQLQYSLSLFRKKEIPVVLTSAETSLGVQEFCDWLEKQSQDQQKEYLQRRRLQEGRWVKYFIDQFLRRELDSKMETNKSLDNSIDDVVLQKKYPRDVARDFLKNLLK